MNRATKAVGVGASIVGEAACATAATACEVTALGAHTIGNFFDSCGQKCRRGEAACAAWRAQLTDELALLEALLEKHADQLQ